MSDYFLNKIMKNLNSYPQLLELPYDNKIVNVKSRSLKRYEKILDEKINDKLLEFSLEKKLDKNIVLFTALLVLLNRYTAQEDIIVQYCKDVEENVFFEANFTECNNFLDAAISVEKTFKETKESDWSYINNSEVSFSFCEATDNYDYNNYLKKNIDIMLVIKKEEQLKFEWLYNEFLFKSDTIERMSANFNNLLLNCMEKSEEDFGTFRFLSEDEEKIINSFFQYQNYPQKSIVEQFQDQVKVHKDKVAVRFGDKEITYKELEVQSNKVANLLKEKGCLKNDNVAILLDRSIEMITSILGVLKAGAAYVPIDPYFPQKRISYILNDSKPEIVITVNEYADKFLNGYQKKNICLDGQGENLNECSIDCPKYDGTLDDVAYIIYTSGSTGKPKGTIMTQRGVSNLAVCDILGIHSESRVLQFSTFSFDASILGVFCSLLKGATLVIASKEQSLDPNLLIKLLDEEKITFTLLSPSLISQLPLEAGRHLEVLVSGGEECPAALAKKWGSRVNFVNLYGPTEATVCVTGWSSKYAMNIPETIPIGFPLPNARIYILDKYKNKVPIGVKGEIYISGPMLAKGYLKNDVMTEKSFVDNPFEENSKMYKTGDLGRFLTNGDIEFYGRIDKQVKIRGYRIEIGEIESVLMNNALIREAVVNPIVDKEGETKLAAYIVTYKKTDKSVIWKYVKEVLPNYMLPSFIVFLDELPKAPTGKVDRKILPDPQEYMEEEGDYVKPITELQKVLSDIWDDVLKVKNNGIYDDFFERGGHSLKITQLVSRINNKFNTKLTIAEAYERPTIAKLESWLIENGVKDVYKQGDYIGIKKVEGRNIFELSEVQKGVWHFEQLGIKKNLYNIVVCFEIQEDIKEDLFIEAFNKVVERQSSLRTNFSIVNGKAVQIVSDKVVVDFEVLKDIDEENLNNIIKSENEYEFNLEKEQLFHSKLITLSDKRKYFLFNCHHIIFDGCSLQILLKEINQFYDILDKNDNSLMTKLPCNYGDYIEWRKELSKTEEFKSHQEYWINELKDKIRDIELPTDYKRPRQLTYKGGVVSIQIDEQLCKLVKDLAGKYKVTEYTVFFTCLFLMMHCYNKEDEMIIGTTVSGRSHSDIEGVIGMFTNTVPIYVNLAQCNTFVDVLNNVKDKLLKALENQDFSFEKLVEKLAPKRELNRHPIYSVVCSQENLENIDENSTIRFSSINTSVETSKFDLTLSINENKEGFKVNIEYSKDLFSEKTINRMLKDYIEILSIGVSNHTIDLPGLYSKCLNKYFYCSINEDNREKNYTQIECVKDLFEKQAEKFSENIAVKFKDTEITYKELNERANCLAHYLIKMGVGQESRVLIIMERSIDMIVGILGIIKAGGAYVPIDPNYPKERISYIMEDSEAKLLITHSQLKDNESILAFKNSVLIIDEIENDKQEKSNPIIKNSINDLLYVIYTSGSTGRPKGVMVTNSNLARLMYVTQPLYKFNNNDVWTMFHSFCFDFSVWEMYGALLHGGKLIVLTKIVAQDSEEFLNLLCNEKVTVLNQTPSAFYRLMDQMEKKGENCDLSNLRYVIFGGEALDFARLKIWFNKYQNNTQLINMYGITETTVHTTYRKITLEDTDYMWKGSPIGKPLSDLKIAILDKDFNPVPFGVTGEMYVSGAGVARCYLNDKEKTDKVFLNGLDIDNNKLRWYKTGDLARFNNKNELEYMGRVDEQVKIRGFRIELKEIEKVMLKHKDVKECIALVNVDNLGDKQIAAYIEFNEHIDNKELRQYAKKYLPDYMIPAYFIPIDEIPLTSNGKVDKKKLPLPNSYRSEEFVEASTKIEKELVEIWKSILGKDEIGITDNFFEIGGHSLKVIDLINQIEEKLDIKLKYINIFEMPTILELAELIESKSNNITECGMKYMYDLEIGDEVVTIYIDEEEYKKNGIPDDAINIRIYSED